MKRLIFVLVFFPLLAQASVGDDINALLDRFFGGDQAPIADPVEPTIPTENEASEPASLIEGSTIELQREIVQQEAELEALETQLRAAEDELWAVSQTKFTSQQQLQLLDEQIALNQRKLEGYRQQSAEWTALVEKLTREKSIIRAQIRNLEREHESLLSKKFIQKQNFELNPTVSWWQWLFSDRSVSQIVADRRQIGSLQTQQAAALEQLKSLKLAFLMLQ